MLVPYSGAALETYNKIHTLRSYETNKLYPFRDTFYYINTKGYLHIYLISVLSFRGHRQYYIANNMLTKDNMLKEATQHSKLFDTKEAAIEFLTSNYQED